MLTRLIRVQVIVFVVIAVVGVAYVGANYAGLDKVIWNTGYTVKAELITGGGVFTNGEVTYRGVAVGKVGQLRLTDSGMEADLDIDSSAQKIPSNVEAVVADRSAVGEQYVDLRPRTDSGPYLTNGSTISEQDTAIPLPVDTVLANLSSFANSVPKPALRTVVDELYNATTGAGPNLETLLDKGIEFVQTATQHVPQVTTFVTDAQTVLNTQRDLSGQISSFGVNAKLLAGTLKSSDGDLRKLIPAVPAAAQEVDSLIRDTGPNLGTLLANLLTVSNVLEIHNRGVEQLLVSTPKAVAAASNVVRGDGAHFGLALNFFDPLPCTSGYGGTPYRSGLDTSTKPLNTDAQCTLPKGDPTEVRGSQHAPGN